MVEGVAAAVTVSVIVTEVEATVTVAVVVLDVDGHVLLHVHGVRHWVGDRDFDGNFDWVRDRPVDGHRHVFFNVHGIWHWFLDGHRVRHVFLHRHDDRPVDHNRDGVHGVHGAQVTVTVVGPEQTVVGQTVPFAVATVPVAQTPKASFALLLFCWLLSGLFGFCAD